MIKAHSHMQVFGQGTGTEAHITPGWANNKSPAGVDGTAEYGGIETRPVNSAIQIWERIA